MSAANSLLSRTATAVWRRRNPAWTLEHPDREHPHLEIPLGAVPRLVLDRATVALARRRSGRDQPWITQDAIGILSTALRKTDIGLEYGSGGSTIWLARHSGQVLAVEESERWHRELADRIERDHIDNATVTLVSVAELGRDTERHRQAYVNAYPDLAPGSLGWVFVDGEYRDACARRAIDLLKVGGLLILDNASTYLPAPGRSPWRVSAPASVLWQEVLDLVADWRHVWTTNGVWDTALWIKA